MTFLVERLADLRQHLDHLREIRPRVTGSDSLVGDLSLHNDVLFSLLMVCQAVIDIAGELAGRRGMPFQDYTEATEALRRFPEVPGAVVDELVLLPGFRNVLIHEYVALDYDRVVDALDRLEPVEMFVRIVAEMEGREDRQADG